MNENQLQDLIRVALNDRDLALWRNNIGQAEIRGRVIRFGVGGAGGSDLIGVFRGRFVAVEIKTPGKSQTQEQRDWQALVESKGGRYSVLRSIEDARNWLETLRKECP